MKKKNKIAIFGPYPPPLGGISVHIQRMEYFLKKENIPYLIYDHAYSQNKNVVPTKKRIFWYIKFLFQREHRLIHFHNFIYFHFLYYVLFYYINKTPFLITIHGERLLNNNRFMNSISFWFLKRLKDTLIISVSNKVHDKLSTLGLNSIYLPAYVQPSEVHKHNIPINNRKYFLFSTWKIEKKLSIDIYNIPLIFEFLKKNKQNFKMLFLIGNKEISDLDYLNEMIDKYGLKEDIVVMFNKNIVDYVHNCEFLIRTNLEDGYGVSLQEAMDLGVPAIASDVCTRPKGTVLFKSADLNDMTDKIKYVVSVDKKEILKDKEDLDYHYQLIDFYKKILDQNIAKIEY